MLAKLQLNRNVLKDAATSQVSSALQTALVDLVDLSLMMKQAHWNILGPNFRSLHLQLDEIIASTREASDEVAERISAIGMSPDGRVQTVAESTSLSPLPPGPIRVEEGISHVADRLHAAIERLRRATAICGEHDPVSEDLLIGILGTLEKHLWMLQAQEDDAGSN